MSISAFDLKLLAVLDAVLGEGSVARAAARLHVTPPAVSNALARLRLRVGDRLVTRRGRGIVPTPRALELAPVLAKALRELEEAVFAQQFDAATSVRIFTLALADPGQQVLLPKIARRMASDMPRAALRAVSIDSLVALGGLAGSEIDAVIGPGEPGRDIHLEPLFREATVLIARRDHPGVRDASVPLRHVAVDMVPGRRFRDLSASAYARAGVARHVVMSVPSFASAAAIVAETDLVATVPHSLFQMLAPRLRLETVVAPIPPLIIAMNLAWHARTHADPACISFRSLVRAAIAELPVVADTRKLARSERGRRKSTRR